MELGRQDIDGVSTRHLRATNPEEMPTPDLGDGMDEDMGHLTKLELWLDDEGLIRRIDATFLDPDALTHVDSPDERWDTKTDVAIRFFDFGAPITIAAPSDWEDLSPEG